MDFNLMCNTPPPVIRERHWDPRSNKLAFLLAVAGALRCCPPLAVLALRRVGRTSRPPGIASRYDRQNAQLIAARAVPADWLERLRTLNAIALHTNHKNLSGEKAKAVTKQGFGLFCYMVNDPARAKEILGWGVDAFCTDRIDLIGPAFA